jgi:hypothetical protein
MADEEPFDVRRCRRAEALEVGTLADGAEEIDSPRARERAHDVVEPDPEAGRRGPGVLIEHTEDPRLRIRGWSCHLR